jgi:iron-sulfur cluster assembly accessory protein
MEAQLETKDNNQRITKDMTIGEMVQQYPSAAEVLTNEGVHCVGCGAAFMETIEQGLAGHGHSDEQISAVVEKLNASIPEQSGNSEELIITDTAASKAKDFLDKRNNEGEALRVKVVVGGCSGKEYKFLFDTEQAESDTLMEISGVKFLIDSGSMDQLKGSKIDYVDGLTDAGFKISNPNAKSTCGCGQSFS